MSKWKQLKQAIKNNYHTATSVYELDYTHVLFKVAERVVYDLNDKKYYRPQTGTI